METTAQAAPVSKGMLWTGYIISGLVVLFMIFDGVTKVMKVPQVNSGFSQTRVQHRRNCGDWRYAACLHGPLCDSAHLHFRRDSVDGLSWRRS